MDRRSNRGTMIAFSRPSGSAAMSVLTSNAGRAILVTLKNRPKHSMPRSGDVSRGSSSDNVASYRLVTSRASAMNWRANLSE